MMLFLKIFWKDSVSSAEWRKHCGGSPPSRGWRKHCDWSTSQVRNDGTVDRHTSFAM